MVKDVVVRVNEVSVIVETSTMVGERTVLVSTVVVVV